MDWIHCNNCFVQLKPGVSLFLTSCGHMFCQSCLEACTTGGHCKICQSTCTTMKLAPDMTPDVQDFFSEPEELIKKLCTILDFQRKHRMRLTGHWISIENKFNNAKEEAKRLYALCHKLNDVVKVLREKNKTLKAQLEKCSASEAVSPFGPPLSPNVSILSPTLTAHPLQRPAKSTPYNTYQSSLVTPARISKHRANSNISQKLGTSHKGSSSGVYGTPSPPASAGSGYFTGSSFRSPTSPEIPGSCVVGTWRRSH